MEALSRCVGFVKGEADEEASSCAQSPLRQDVARHTPVLLEDSLRDNENLASQRHGKLLELVFIGCMIVCSLTGVFVQGVDISLNLLAFLASLPHFMPIWSLAG